MWALYLVGGLATVGVLLVVLPILAVLGVAALAELMAGGEVDDDET